MPEQELLHHFLFIFAGFVLGVVTVLLVNKLRSGSASPVKIKREMEQYQADVEAHFDETSEKFKKMAVQYQDLYKHLSVGATTLCRPENIAPGLSDARDPLAAIENKSAQAEPKPVKTDAQTKDSKAKETKREKTQPKKADIKKSEPEVKASAGEKKPAADKTTVAKKASATNKEPVKPTLNKKT